MNIYLPGPSIILRHTISCGVELASPALTALGEHVGDADNIAHTAYKAGGKPISTTFSDLRRRRGSRPAALVCTTVERVASKVFYHKYRLLGTAKKAINTAIAVLETVEAVCAYHIQETDSAPPAESLTSAAILGTRPCASAKITLPPRTVSLAVGAFYRLSTIFGGDFHVKLADFLSHVSPRGFLLLKTALEDIYEWLIETTKEHIRFGRERYPILPRTTFYLLTVSIAVLVFLLAIISAFPADGVVRRHAPQAPGGGNSRGDDDVHDVHNCDGDRYPGEGSSNDASVEVAEGSYDAEDENTSIGEEDTLFQDRSNDGSETIQKVYVDLGNDESESEHEGEKKKTIKNPAIVPERVEIVLMITTGLEDSTESEESKSDIDSAKDKNKAVELATAVVGFGGFEVDDSLVCKFEQTGSHGAANAAPLTPTLPHQIRVEMELPDVTTVAQAAPSTPTSYTAVAHKHKKKEIQVKRSRKTFRYPRTARKNPRVAPKKKKTARPSSTSRTIFTSMSSAILSTPARVPANQKTRPLSRTPSIAPPSSVSILARQRTRPRSFQDLMKDW